MVHPWGSGLLPECFRYRQRPWYSWYQCSLVWLLLWRLLLSLYSSCYCYYFYSSWSSHFESSRYWARSFLQMFFLILTSSLLAYSVFSPITEEATEVQRDELLSPGHRGLDGTTGSQTYGRHSPPFSHSQPPPRSLDVGQPQPSIVEGGLARVSLTGWPLSS